jgi:cytochrome bd-type quinol oxidase subunit 2
MTYDPAREQLSEDGDAEEVRNETPGERLDRKWNDILQELRVVMTGTQLITGFLLAVAFQPKFDELERSEVILYLVLVVLATTATMLGLAPVILHRELSGQKQKERVVRIANVLLLTLLVVVSLVAAGVAMLIFDVTVSRPAGWIAGAIALVLLLVFWIVVPRIGKREPRQR